MSEPIWGELEALLSDRRALSWRLETEPNRTWAFGLDSSRQLSVFIEDGHIVVFVYRRGERESFTSLEEFAAELKRLEHESLGVDAKALRLARAEPLVADWLERLRLETADQLEAFIAYYGNDPSS